MKILKALKILSAGAAMAVAYAGQATAADILCETVTNNHMLVPDTQVVACLDAGVGNINGNPVTDDFLTGGDPDAAGWVLADGATPFAQAGSSGTWSYDYSLWSSYSELAVGFKFGTGNEPDEWFVYSLAMGECATPGDGTCEGTWTFVNVFGKGGGLSHAIIYGKDGPDTFVPVPATAALLGLGLLGMGFIRRRAR